MDRRTKAALNRDKAVRLNEAWGVGAAQVRYGDDGHWYATLTQFPAALFDAHGYVLFPTEAEYRTSPHLNIEASKSAFRNPVFPRFQVMSASPTLTHSPASTWTFTPSPPPKAVVVWSCTFSANGIRPSCATRRSRLHRSTARFAGFRSAALTAAPRAITARFTTYCRCPMLRTAPKPDSETLRYCAPTAIASFICTTRLTR